MLEVKINKINKKLLNNFSKETLKKDQKASQPNCIEHIDIVCKAPPNLFNKCHQTSPQLSPSKANEELVPVTLALKNSSVDRTPSDHGSKSRSAQNSEVEIIGLYWNHALNIHRGETPCLLVSDGSGFLHVSVLLPAPRWDEQREAEYGKE